ncbi:pathogenicity island protein [Staphylococcus chromogenes]|uniref:pathogenicity island protein n=1 Tax=Staphylococcus chromogenes TaxID=46126 RepID=UPI002903BA57|nr:pathogenicity island protein [Staphylococcus chromogenes]MDU0429275.1 pathogenicity island protein [Staphylococcus chromogenes]
MNDIKSELVRYISENVGTSFVEIERIFQENNFDYKGNGAYTSTVNSNILYWYGWNKQAFKVVSELVNDSLIEMNVCEPFIYFIDGKGLNLPIVKSKSVNTYHWLPVTFSVNYSEKKNIFITKEGA